MFYWLSSNEYNETCVFKRYWVIWIFYTDWLFRRISILMSFYWDWQRDKIPQEMAENGDSNIVIFPIENSKNEPQKHGAYYIHYSAITIMQQAK